MTLIEGLLGLQSPNFHPNAPSGNTSHFAEVVLRVFIIVVSEKN